MACGPAAQERPRGAAVLADAAAGQPERRRAAVADSATLENQCHPRKIFIGGLAHKTTTQQLRDYFARYGAIVDAVVLRWPDGRSRGFGYVTFAEASAASGALRGVHQVGGRQIDVKRAVPGTNKLFVGGLPQNAAATELREHFEAFGVVSDAVVMIDPVTGRSRGFGFVCFLPGQEGAAAVTASLEQYDNHRLRGKWIEVKSAASPHKLAAKEAGSRTPQDAAAPAPSPAPASASDAAAPPGAAAPGGAKDWRQPAATGKLAADARQPAASCGPMTDARPVASPHRHRGGQQRGQAGGRQSVPGEREPRKVALPGTAPAAMSAAIAAMGTPPGLTPPLRATDSPSEGPLPEPLPAPAYQAVWSSAAAAADRSVWPGSSLSLANALRMPPAAAAAGQGGAPSVPHHIGCPPGDFGFDPWGHGAPALEQGGRFATSYSLVKSLEQLLKQQSLSMAAEKAAAVGTDATGCTPEVQ